MGMIRGMIRDINSSELCSIGWPGTLKLGTYGGTVWGYGTRVRYGVRRTGTVSPRSLFSGNVVLFQKRYRGTSYWYSVYPPYLFSGNLWCYFLLDGRFELILLALSCKYGLT